MDKDQKKYWFKNKRFGFGWGLPATWQGWTVMIVYAVVLFIAALVLLDEAPEDQWSSELGWYFGVVFVSTMTIIAIGYKKGPKPTWRWGCEEDKNKSDK